MIIFVYLFNRFVMLLKVLVWCSSSPRKAFLIVVSRFLQCTKQFDYAAQKARCLFSNLLTHLIMFMSISTYIHIGYKHLQLQVQQKAKTGFFENYVIALPNADQEPVDVDILGAGAFGRVVKLKTRAYLHTICCHCKV